MSQVKQILQLFKQGYPVKKIARELQISKNTVKAYRDKIGSGTKSIEELLSMDVPVLEQFFHAGNAAYKHDRFDILKERLDWFISELKRPHVTRFLLWQEYKAAHPDGYEYTQFCHHLSQHMKAGSVVMHLEHQPGDKLYIDFAGDKLSYTDMVTGEIIACQVFVACLPYSDYSFALAVRSQNIEDFLYALGMCLEHLGGVPKIVVPDNLKAAVIKATRYDPDINHALEDFAGHYGFVVLPARPQKPRDKGGAENQVKLVYQRIYAKLRNQTFTSLGSLNQSISEKNKEHTQTRMQRHPYSREERFLSAEKPVLGPLPDTPYEIKYYRELSVAKNNHIYLSADKHYYSVPYRYTGMKVKVIYTRSMVHIYAGGEQVAVHMRDLRPGRYTTDSGHLCSHHRHYLDRSPAYYVGMARKKSVVLAEVFMGMFENGEHPELQYRSCDGLLSLQRKTDTEVFDQACRMAIEHVRYSYRFIRNIIDNKMTDKLPEADKKQKLPPAGENTRGKEYFIQKTLNFNHL